MLRNKNSPRTSANDSSEPNSEYKRMSEGSGEKKEGGGCCFCFTHLWYFLKIFAMGIKWNMKELFSRHKRLIPEELPSRSGQVAVITGGGRGIGVDVVKKLLLCDMHVIIGCRNVNTGEEMVNRLRDAGVKKGSTTVLSLDLTSLKSVKQFAMKVLSNDNPTINILINNAGIMFVPLGETEDGFETHFQVNYLSHFYLTALLLSKLMGSGTEKRMSRVVNVSSVASFGGDFNECDLENKVMYSKYRAYMDTKFYQILHSNYLDRIMGEKGAFVHAYSVHPGMVQTDLYGNIPFASFLTLLTKPMYKTQDQGADTVAYAAVSPDIENEGGLFLANSTKETANIKSYNEETQKKLWNMTLSLLGIKDPTVQMSGSGSTSETPSVVKVEVH